MENAHFNLHIAPEEIHAVTDVLAETLDYFNEPEKSKE